ncbi:MAG: DinB family protein [Ginsengibacter sp.]
MPFNYLESVIKYFRQQKSLGDKTIEQLSEENLLWQYNENSNSIAIIVNHLWGNMLSRWSNFLTEDGEKEWRNRDTEFEKVISSKEELIKKWNEGWQCVLDALKSLKEEDLSKTIFIRKEPHNVGDAINRQMAHYSNHVGQIVYIGKMVLDEKWKSLSIPKGKSKDFNNKMMSGK